MTNIPEPETSEFRSLLLVNAMLHLNEDQKMSLAYNLFVRLPKEKRDKFISDYEKGIGVG